MSLSQRLAEQVAQKQFDPRDEEGKKEGLVNKGASLGEEIGREHEIEW